MLDIVVSNFGADETSGIAALGFDPKAFLIQLITFLLAYLVLRRYAFGPILEVLKRRRETIESSVTLAEKLQKDQQEFEEKVEKMLQETRIKSDEIIRNAHENARGAIKEAEDKAREKTEVVMADAETRIATETARARQKLEKELAGLISEATEAIIEEKIDAKKDAALIGRALKEVKSS